jgi:molybdate transport system regulatory protein
MRFRIVHRAHGKRMRSKPAGVSLHSSNTSTSRFATFIRGGPTSKEHDMQTSARNQFSGEVAEVKHGAVNDEVTLRTQDGLEIVAVITHGSATSLGLAAGKKAFALVKASSVIVMVDVAKSQVSARNCIAGNVSAVTRGAVNSEVIISAGGAQIAAIITNESVDRLGLASGNAATAIFKASSVIIGVDQ